MNRDPDGLCGLLLVDKPRGWTSHDVVAKLRRATGQRRIGHAGTLDPAATGLLVLCLGRATRLVEEMTGHDKEYEGLIRLGERTATDDGEGEVVERRDVPDIRAGNVRELEERFTGEIEQVPPRFSAIKVGGERSYARARVGVEFELAPRRVVIHELSLEPADANELSIRVRCGTGTYVRSLARDIGEAMGCGGHLGALRRTRSGPFAIEDASGLAALVEVAEAGLIDRCLLPPDDGITSESAAIVRDEGARRLATGMRLSGGPEGEARPRVRLYTAGGEFLGMCALTDAGELLPRKIMARI